MTFAKALTLTEAAELKGLAEQQFAVSLHFHDACGGQSLFAGQAGGISFAGSGFRLFCPKELPRYFFRRRYIVSHRKRRI